MINLISDNTIAFLGGIVAVFEIIDSIKKKFTFLSWLIILLTVSITILSVINNNKKIAKEREREISDSANSKRIEYLVNSHERDSLAFVLKNLRDIEFQKRLMEKPFGIYRDSITNSPKRIVYNTTIGSAQTVNIGPK